MIPLLKIINIHESRHCWVPMPYSEQCSAFLVQNASNFIGEQTC